MISVKVISLFFLEGEFCDYSTLLHTTEFFLPPTTYFPIWKNGADKASFTHEDWGWFEIKHIRKTHGERTEQ